MPAKRTTSNKEASDKKPVASRAGAKKAPTKKIASQGAVTKAPAKKAAGKRPAVKEKSVRKPAAKALPTAAEIEVVAYYQYLERCKTGAPGDHLSDWTAACAKLGL